MKLTLQISELIDNLFERIKKEENYKNALAFLKEKTYLAKFDGMEILNKYFGTVELRALMILCYAFNEHGDLAASPKIMKYCTKIICCLIG